MYFIYTVYCNFRSFLQDCYAPLLEVCLFLSSKYCEIEPSLSCFLCLFFCIFISFFFTSINHSKWKKLWAKAHFVLEKIYCGPSPTSAVACCLYFLSLGSLKGNMSMNLPHYSTSVTVRASHGPKFASVWNVKIDQKVPFPAYSVVIVQLNRPA